MRGSAPIVAAAIALVALVALPAAAFGGDSMLRGGGVQLVVPDGWGEVVAADGSTSEPKTLLVVGTRGAKPIESRCQVAAYRVPVDGAVVVVIGWRDSIGDKPALQLSKLRRPTFDCFAGRGSVGQVTRRERDFQVNVMVGDKADSTTVADALAVARSFQIVRR
jgi:hypothetical protein